MTDTQATYTAGDHASPERRARACGTCRFWAGSVMDEELGECRIAPPVAAAESGDLGAWPQTVAHGWCGMWQHDRRGNQPPARRVDDAIGPLMRSEGMTFPEAVNVLRGMRDQWEEVKRRLLDRGLTEEDIERVLIPEVEPEGGR